MSPSAMPLYHQVASVLRQRVLDGDYPPGFRLPPEDVLADEFQVSRATLRQAVGELVQSGMIARRQGRGTFVLDDPRASLGQVFRGTIAELLSEVRRSKVRDIEIERRVPIPSRIAAELELASASATIVRRVRLWDGQPFAYTVNYLPDDVGERLTKSQLRSQSLMALLESNGIVADSARQTIRATLADITTSNALGIPLGEPVLAVERRLLDAGGRPISFVVSSYRGDLYEYTVEFERGEVDMSDRFA